MRPPSSRAALGFAAAPAGASVNPLTPRPYRRVMRAVVAALVAAAGLPGCGLASAVIERQAISRAEFSFVRADVQRADLPFLDPAARADLRVVLGVRNPNPVAAVLDRLDYQVLVADHVVSEGALAEEFRVGAGGRAELVLPVAIRYQGVARPVLETIERRELALAIRGVSHLATPLGTLDFPLEVGGRANLDSLVSQLRR